MCRVAWTVVGTLGFVLAVMASGRIIAWAVGLRKASSCYGGGGRPLLLAAPRVQTLACLLACGPCPPCRPHTGALPAPSPLQRLKQTRATLPGGAVIWKAPPPMDAPRDSKAFASSDAYEAPPEYKPPPVYAAPQQAPPPTLASLPPAEGAAPANGELDTFVKHPHGPYAAVR